MLMVPQNPTIEELVKVINDLIDRLEAAEIEIKGLKNGKVK